LTLPLAALRLALDLEARGLHMRSEDGDVLLIVGPRNCSPMTTAQRFGGGPHLLAIVTYNADAPGAHAMKPGIAARTLNEAVRALVAERDENTCRKDFAPSEAVALARDLEPFERQDARERQREHGRTLLAGRALPANCRE